MENLSYLEILSEKYPTAQSAYTEIINLQAILNLPKGTEHFFSDLHGEDKAFIYLLKGASGVVGVKVDEALGYRLSPEQRAKLLKLIHYPREEIAKAEREAESFRNSAEFRITPPEKPWRLPGAFRENSARKQRNWCWRRISL